MTILREDSASTDSRCSALADNAPAHTSQVAMTAATECRFEVLPHPYFFLIWPHLTSVCSQNLRGTQFGSNEGAIEAVNEYLGDQEKDFYLEGISKVEQRRTKCIALKADYI